MNYKVEAWESKTRGILIGIYKSAAVAEMMKELTQNKFKNLYAIYIIPCDLELTTITQI